MNKQAGILIDRMNLSQLGVKLSVALNEIEVDYTDLDVILFNGTQETLPTIARFALMQQCEAWDLAAPVMATSLNTAQMLLKMPCPTRKYFYVYNLEWIYLQNTPPYSALQSVYQNDDIELIARSDSHYDVLKRCWKEPIATIEDFDYKQLAQILQRE